MASVNKGCKIENVPLDCIDLDNDDYKISKPCADERLKYSIHASGLLEPAALLKDNGQYIIIHGHNRLRILKELNIISAPAFVLDVLDPGAYIDSVILKDYRGEIGPIGKIKFICILKIKLKLNENDIASAAKNMQLPEDFLRNDLRQKLLSLPEPLRDYIDSRNTGFKLIKNILRLADEALRLLAEWVADMNMRVNIFKGIVDLLFDICKRDKTLDGLSQIGINFSGDRRKKEEFFYAEIFKIRYPGYTNIKNKADNIIGNLRKNGIEIDFPEYFEKDEIWIKSKLSKRDNLEFFKQRLDQLDTDALKTLLDLL